MPAFVCRSGVFEVERHFGQEFVRQEGRMQVPAWGVLLLVLLFYGPQPCTADQFDGKLERVDLKTVTLVGCNNQKLVVTVDQKEREKAAAHLGKTVTVHFKTDNGEHRAVFFRARY